MKNTQEYIGNNKEKFLEDLFKLLRVPSISADAAYNEDTRKTAELVQASLVEAGADKVQLFETAGQPIVYGEKIIDANLPTILVYGHYDVQPAVPLELWESDPFEPVVRKTEIHPDGAIYARGACDDKGQMFMHVKAFEAMMKAGELPCNVKFVIEGEEEIGSGNLEPFTKEYKDMLSCDVILVSDTGIIANDTPSICTGLRGICAAEIELTGPNRDLHSGLYGGAVNNPLNAMCELVAKLKNEEGVIQIPGFYEGVPHFSDAERALMAEAPFSQEEFNKSIDITEAFGEAGFSTKERSSIRPTLDLNGIWGGYQGEGSKTIIPSKAHAKITMRLVGDQKPADVAEKFTKYVESIVPPGMRLNLEIGHGGTAYVTPTDIPEYMAASKAMETTFGKLPIPSPSGGSIPIMSMFEEVLQAKPILMGFGLDSDAIHSPNEHYGLFNYYKGIETIPYFYKYYTELKK